MDPTQIPIRDLHLPEPIGWWPLAPGWWVLIALLFAGLAWLLVKWVRRYRAAAARRYALRSLKAIEARFESGENVVTLCREVSELVRRAMLAYAPREDVAGLTGDAWLTWLDTGLANPTFETGAGRAIVEAPYRDPERDYDDIDFNGLVYAVRMRLATPVGRAA